MSVTPHATHCSSCGQEYAAEGLFCPACGTPRSRDASGDPLMGAVLGQRFLILERIGHGASGTIYRGEHVTLRRKVAIKVLHHELSRDDLAVERFRREATTVSEIDNEHIVEILDFGHTADGRLYLAMELLAGETLQDRIKRDRRLPVDLAADILIQLGEALMEAHAMGYVHRDLRPRNIYLAQRRGRKNFVKLLDFGLAKLVENEGPSEATSLGMTFGDPKYMSPEQARGEALDRRADIYSLGCIAYEMLVGQAPFAAGKVFDILTQQVDGTAPAPRARRSDVPAWLDSAVMCMLAKRPEDRFVTVYRLIEALRQGLQTGETMSAEQARQRETTPPPSVSRAMERLAERDLGWDGETRENQAIGAQTIRVSGVPPLTTDQAESDAAEHEPDRGAGEGEPEQSAGAGEHDQTEAAGEHDQAEARPVAARRSTPGKGAEDDRAEDDRAEDDRAADERAADERAADSASGLSGAWFAEPEDGNDLDDGDRARLDEARASMTADDLYYDPTRKPWAKIAAVAGGVLVLIIVVIVMASRSGTSHRKDTSESAGVTTDDVQARLDSAARSAAQTDTAAAADGGTIDAPGAGEANHQATDTAAAGQPGKDGKDDSKDRKSGKDSSGTSDRHARTHRGDRGTDRTDPEDELRDPFMDPLGRSEQKDSSKDAQQAAFFAKLGQNNLRNGDVNGALGNFKKALDRDPKNVDAIIGQGEIALRTGSYGAAVKHLKKAASMRSRSAHVHTLLGEAYLSTGNDARAAASFKRALKLDPDNARARDGYNEAAGKIPPPPEDEE